MLVIGGMMSGAALGAYRAHKLGGKLADKFQYAAGYGLLFTMIGVALTFLIHRLLA